MKKKSYAKVVGIIFLILVLAAFFMLYVKEVATKKVVVHEYAIYSEKITEDFEGLKLVHFSDVDYGTTINKKELKEAIEKINVIRPDLVVFTGDLAYQDGKEEELISLLSNIQSTSGKYAVSGEYDLKSKEWKNIMQNSGFTILDDTYEVIYGNQNNRILLSGISSNLVNTNPINEKTKTTQDFINQNPNLFHILLLHEPDYADKVNLENYDLILSGHSHNGYINLPFLQTFFLEEGAKKYYKPFYNIKDTSLYISGGLGTTTFSYRFCNRPSINFYRIRKAG